MVKALASGALLLGILISINANADICDKWFSKSKVKIGKSCMIDCAMIPVDMGTFECPNYCSEFCKESIGTDFIFTMSDLYPGLTTSERALVAQFPKEAVQVFSDKYKAESMCAKQFGNNRTNDESDACRHFIWASLLRKNLGSDMAQKFLSAHEQQSGQPENEKAMDLANNRTGLLAAERLLKEKKFSETRLIQELESALKRRRLIVIDRKFKEWKAK